MINYNWLGVDVSWRAVFSLFNANWLLTHLSFDRLLLCLYVFIDLQPLPTLT